MDKAAAKTFLENKGYIETSTDVFRKDISQVQLKDDYLDMFEITLPVDLIPVAEGKGVRIPRNNIARYNYSDI